jgi:hypothetical protein
MKEIENFKTVHLVGDFSGQDAVATFKLNIPFEVDEIILKYVNFINNATNVPDGPDMSIVKTNLINDIIFTFPLTQSFFEAFNTPFKTTTRRIQGDYEFRIIDSDPTEPPPGFTNLKMTLVFIFVKYRE